MADTPLRSLLAEFVVQVDRAGALAKGNAQVDALKKKLEQLQEAAKPAAQAVGDAFAQAGGSQFTRRAQASVFKGRGSEDAFLQLGKTGGPLLPGLLRPLRQEPAPVPTAPPSGARYQTPEALANVFARAAAGAQRNLQALNASSFTGGGSGDGFLSAAFRTPGNGPQFGPTRETYNEAKAAAEAYAGTLQGKLASAVQSVRNAFGGGGGGGGGTGLVGVLRLVRGGLAALGITAAIAAIHRLANEFKELVEGIGKIQLGAQRLGVSTDDFQRLDVLAKQSGTSVEALGVAFKDLSKAAVEPTKETANAFAQLGVQTKDSSGQFKSANDLFWDTTAALAGVTDETKRNALAQNLLGRSAQELKPLFAEGTKAVLERREAMKSLPVLTEETIKQSKKLSDTWQTVGAHVLKAAEPLIQLLLPAVQSVTDAFNDIVDAVAQFGRESHYFEHLGAVIKTIILPTQLIFRGFKSLIGLLGGQGVHYLAMFEDVLGRIGLAFTTIVEILPLLIDDFVGYLNGKDSLIGRAIKALEGGFGKIFESILAKAKAIGPEILNAIVPEWLRGFLTPSGAGGTGSIPAGPDKKMGAPSLPQLFYGPPTAEGSVRGNAPIVGDINVNVTASPNASAKQLVDAGFNRAHNELEGLVEAYGGFQ